MSRPSTSSARLVAEAEAEVVTLSPQEAREAQRSGALLVDIRDVRELRREGTIPQSYHAPRGFLEFWVDPASDYHREALTAAPKLVLFCNLGWRSALAAKSLQDMGVDGVAHVGGGYESWRDAGLPTAEYDR